MIHPLKSLVRCIPPLVAASLSAAEPVLIQDLNTAPNLSSAYPQNFISLESALLFTATDLTHGTELWRSDGTAAGTDMLRDINPGLSEAFPSGALATPSPRTVMRGIAYFRADDGINGSELWRSDGTAEGTFPIKDLRPGPEGSDPGWFCVVGDALYFTANDGIHGPELWKTDGTGTGTAMVSDIPPDHQEGDAHPLPAPGGLTPFDGRLFFTAHDGTSDGLWMTDGTAAGTRLVRRFLFEHASYYPSGLTVAGGRLYFAAYEPEHGAELWTSDGTAAGTKMVRDIVDGAEGSKPTGFSAVNGILLFIAGDPIHGQELWRSDGTAGGTVLVKDVHPGVWFGLDQVITNLVPWGNQVYFSANDGVHGLELWKSDGTPEGTAMVRDLNPGAQPSRPGSLTNFNGALYFSASTAETGRELWKTDGTADGTIVVKDLFTGSGSGDPANLTARGNVLFFSGRDSASQAELWKTDGTAAGTARVKDLQPGTADGPVGFVAHTLKAALFPWHEDLWKTNGTAAGTAPVVDLSPAAYPAGFQDVTAAGDTLFFLYSSTAHGAELWKTTPSPAAPVMVKDIRKGPDSSWPRDLTSVGPLLFFTVETSVGGRDLWRTDGTDTGTFFLKGQPPPGYAGWEPFALTSMGGQLYFLIPGETDTQLWKSDGSLAGTALITAFEEVPWKMTVVGDSLFFFFDRSRELWKSDGTAGTTALVTGMSREHVSFSPPDPVGWDGSVYFVARGNGDDQLWVSNGTAEGTRRLLALRPGEQNLSHLIPAGGKLFFTSHGSAPSALWKTDGTAAGTSRVREWIAPWETLSYEKPIAAGNALYLAAFDRVHGSELWRSDGTMAGTAMVADITGNSGSSEPQEFFAAGSTLCFTATTEAYGREFWSLSTLAPDVSVKGNGLEIGSTTRQTRIMDFTDFGPAALSGGTITRTFQVHNTGGEVLTLGNAGVTGDGAADFSITSQPSASVAPGGVTSLQITFDPSLPGTRSAAVRLPSNDAEENPYTFTISGWGGSPLRVQWRMDNFGTAANTGDAADDADPDSDGVPNLLEWACRQNPKQRDTQLLSATVSDAVIEFRSFRSVAALNDGAGFTVEWSDSLTGTWSGEGVTEETSSDDGTLREVISRVPAGSGGRRFVRLRVADPPP